MSALTFITALAAQAGAASSTAPTSTVASAQQPSHGSQTYADLEASGGYSSNPNLEHRDNAGSAFGRISIHGVHTRVSERTTTVVSAFAQNTFYASKYGAQQSFDLSARHDARVNERLQVFGDADAAYDKGGQLDTRILSVPNVPLPPGATQPPSLTPVGDFISVTGRNYSASGHIGAQLALGSHDYLNGSSGIEYSAFKSGDTDTHYDRIPVSLGYGTQISQHTTVGGRVTAEFTNYTGPSDTRIVTPQLTIRSTISERFSVTGAIGVSFAKVDNLTGSDHSTGVSADGSMCLTGDRDNFCGSVAIQQEAATVAGPAKTLSAGLNYSLRIDAAQTIHLSASASRYSTPRSIITGQPLSDATYFHAAADYSRQLGNRLFGGLGVGARKDTLRNGPDAKADVSGYFFVRYRIGSIQ